METTVCIVSLFVLLVIVAILRNYNRIEAIHKRMEHLESGQGFDARHDTEYKNLQQELQQRMEDIDDF